MTVTQAELSSESLPEDTLPQGADLQAQEPAPAERPERAGRGTDPLAWQVTRRRVRPWVWWTLGTLVTLLAGAVTLWFLLPVKHVTVTGNDHLSAAEVRQLAGLGGEVGWLFYGGRQASGLLSSPWVKSATVLRKFPDTVQIELVERRPVLQTAQPSGETVAVAEDGRVLPGAGDLSALPTVTGWGPERLTDAALIAEALSRYTVQSVVYTPSGMTIKTATGTLWSGDLKSIVKYAGSISMYPNKTINIYPWGVSVQQ
ncbi:FtsQ-type POTRA domain-containing protein [Deinococcus sp.]|uniref:cell division protein FtsQ/DivIB n=1 Tax=Deinococcus sp. TaxID=47478 RepID=UPI0025BEFF83|nr:FtsQ-type POTRA domain-containing protein [Deinococcus sp.]